MLDILKRARSNAEEYFGVFGKRRRLDVSTVTSTSTLANSPTPNLANPPIPNLADSPSPDLPHPPTPDPTNAPIPDLVNSSSAQFISRLPTELLINVFKLLLEDHLAQPDVLFKCHAPQVVLALVCREWKAVVCSLPQLWSCIPAGASASYASHCLNRSAGLPLRLGLKFGVSPWCKSEPDFKKHAQYSLKPLIVAKSGVPRIFLNARVRELAVYVSPCFVGHFDDDRVWHEYTFPDVDTLHVSFKKTQFDADVEAAVCELKRVAYTLHYELQWVDSDLLPSLRHMRLDGMDLPGHSMGLPTTLYSLELSLIEPSQRKIQKRKDNHSISTLEHLVDDIGSIVDLQRLSIDFSDAFYFSIYQLDIDPSRTTTLPHLREITLSTESENILDAISSAINLPALRRCVLSLNYNSGVVYRGFRRYSIKDTLQSAFRNFIAQLSSAGAHLHTLYLSHRRSASGTTTTSVIASADPVDWTNTYASRDTLSQANLHVTLICDIESPATSRERREVVEAFLCAFLSCAAPDSISDVLPITSIALSIDDDILSKLICEKVFLGRLPHVETIACYDGHEEVLVELHARPSSFPGLQTLITPDIDANQEPRAALDAMLEERENLSHVQVDGAAAGVLREVAMRAAT